MSILIYKYKPILILENCYYY